MKGYFRYHVCVTSEPMTKCISSNVVKVGLKTKKILYMFSLVYEYKSILMKSWSSTKALIIKKDKCDHKFREFEKSFFLEKDVFFFVLSRAWDKEKILSPHEESNLSPSDSALWCSTTETPRWASSFYEVHRTRVLHTARISNVDSVMFVNRNKRDGKFWVR